jgi:hypothetical protein
MGPNDNIESGGAFNWGDNDRGIALIIVLVMLLLFSILGATMLATSTSELKIAGNYRNSEESFYTAEAALAFAFNFTPIYDVIDPNLIPGATGTVWPVAGAGKVLDTNFNETAEDNDQHGHNKNFNRITIPGTQNSADVKVEYVGKFDQTPPGSGYQMDSGVGSSGGGFKTVNYLVSVIAYGPNNSQAQVESMYYNVVASSP